MKLLRIFLPVLFLLVIASSIPSCVAQTPLAGQLLESLSFKSDILGKDVKYCIYLPSDYNTSSRRYPVVYLLHGYTDDETGWVQFGEAHLIADQAIAAREIPPMIIVMPDAGVTWYVNDAKGQVRYEDMFVQELIPYIDTTYRTRAKKEFRAVAGLSMGGYGSLVYAMHHPELFATCAPFSAAVRDESEIIATDQERYDRMWGKIFGEKLSGKARLTPHLLKNDPLNLAKTLPVEGLKSVRWYIDCGDDDFLTKGNALLHIAFKERGIPHEYRMRNGAHNWTYWRTGLPDALKFIGESFHR